MADNLLIANEVEKTIRIKVEDTSAPLRRLLSDMANEINKLKERVKAIENGN